MGTAARRGAAVAVAGLLALVLAGCPAGPDRAEPAPTTPAPTGSSPPTPSGTAPSPAAGPTAAAVAAVPELAAGPAAPRLALRATVDLSPATPGTTAVPLAAVGAPDGSAAVLLAPVDSDPPLVLATVSQRAGRPAVTGTVALPALRQVWGLHRLPDGSVLVAGQFALPDSGYGFVVAGPGGAVRSSVVVPFEQGTALVTGHSALSPDGRTVDLWIGTDVEGRQLDLLSAADVATGRQTNGRDLFEEVRHLSVQSAVATTTALLPRPDGGVTVVFDAYPDPDDATFGRVPTVLAYSADLEPVGVPVVLSRPADRLHSEVAAVTPDGTVYLVADGPDGDRVASVAPGASTATSLLELPGHTYDRGLVVDPAGRWVLLPAAGGVRAVDVATRDAATVGLGCDPEQAPGTVAPGGPPGAVLLLGRCRQPRPGTATLWLLGVG